MLYPGWSFGRDPKMPARREPRTIAQRSRRGCFVRLSRAMCAEMAIRRAVREAGSKVPTTRREGVQVRHARRCEGRGGAACSCSPSCPAYTGCERLGVLSGPPSSEPSFERRSSQTHSLESWETIERSRCVGRALRASWPASRRRREGRSRAAAWSGGELGEGRARELATGPSDSRKSPRHVGSSHRSRASQFTHPTSCPPEHPLIRSARG